MKDSFLMWCLISSFSGQLCATEVIISNLNLLESQQSAREQAEYAGLKKAVSNYKIFCEQFKKDIESHCDGKLVELMSSKLRPCVIIDVDDTALDKMNEYARRILLPDEPPFPLFRANKVILELCTSYFEPKKIDVFYVTARDEDLRWITSVNLEGEGYPKVKNLCCIPSKLREDFIHQHGPIRAHYDEFRSFIGQWKHEQYTLLQESGYTVLAVIDDEPENLKKVESCGFLFQPLSYWYLLGPTQ